MRHYRSFFKKFGIDKKVFYGVGISFSVMAAIIGIFIVLFWGVFALRGWIENYISESIVFHLSALPQATTTNTLPVPITQYVAPMPLPMLTNLFTHTQESSPSIAPSVQTQQQNLVYDVLIDLFSGNGWIGGGTTLYQDMMMTSFLFTPKFTLERSSFSSSASFIGRKSDGSDDRCISHRCLTQKGNALTFDGRQVLLPIEVRNETIVSVSIGSLKSKWPVGIVTKNGDDYSGWLFIFDGSQFKNIQQEGKEVFLSKYGASIGFGGIDTDWVAVYGSYDGKAVHVRNSAITDISRFFGIRVMSGGFDPEITRTEAGGDITWFVWNKSGNPKLVKLFENGTNSIVGATDFSLKIGPMVPSATLMQFSASSNPHILDVKISDGGTEYWKFTDEGFDNSSQKEIVSASLTNRLFPVRLAIIPRAEYSDVNDSVDFYLSNDGVDWVKTKIGDTVNFKNQNGYKAFWRAVVRPPANKYYSPYLGLIEVNYAFERQ